MKNTMITYLNNLQHNNDREWYHAHKEERMEAEAQFEYIIQGLLTELGKSDSSLLMLQPKDLTFKLVRDTRFSKDKSPYLPAFRCHIASSGKLPVPVGSFLYIHPENRSFLGGGLFADIFKDATMKIRDYLSANGEQWQEIISNPVFTKYFCVGGKALKSVPRGYDSSHPQAQYLKNKSWYLEYSFEDKKLEDPDLFIDYAAEIFHRMKPFNDFLNKALKGFQMPER